MQAEIQTDRLLLRPLRASDAGPIAFWAARPEIARMTALPHPYPPGAAESFVAATLSGRSGEQVWAMDATQSGGEAFIGSLGLKRADEDKARLRYWLGPDLWGAGYATEAAQAVIAAWFAAPGHRTLISNVYEDNAASRRVLEKLGFAEFERDMAFNIARGRSVPLLRLRLTREAWEAGRCAA